MLYNLQFVAKTEKNAKGSVWRHDYIQLGYLRPLIIVEITIKYYAGAASCVGCFNDQQNLKLYHSGVVLPLFSTYSFYLNKAAHRNSAPKVSYIKGVCCGVKIVSYFI